VSAVRFDGIHDALLSRGFRQEAVLHPVSYTGAVRVGPESVNVEIAFPDFELQRLPTIRLTTRPDWVPPGCNHVNASNVVCYGNTGLAFVDRYQADRQILFCLDRAAEVLNDVRRGNVLGDVDQEFAYYWNGAPVLIDTIASSDPQHLNVLTLNLDGRELTLIVSAGAEAMGKYSAYRPVERKLDSAIVIPAVQTPAVRAAEWPPKTLQDFLRWLGQSAPAIRQLLRKQLSNLNGRGVRRVLFIFQALPTWFGVGFHLPVDAAQIKFRHPKGFINAIEHRAATLALERFTPIRVDSDYLVNRNLRDGEQSLLAKRILLIGCGTIGGHVAHALARAGVGFGSGMLALADAQIFLGGNIGRLRLGIDALLLPKAEALQKDLQHALPGIDARPFVRSALELPLQEFDLIVDATGEEQFSEALNAKFVAGGPRAIVFSWVVGNGIAAQTFTLASHEQACLRCWKSHGDVAAFSPARELTLNARVGHGCDDPYVPFSGAASLVAAGLTLQAVLDWSSGHPNPTLRTIELDHKSTHHVKPKTPAKNSACPACGR